MSVSPIYSAFNQRPASQAHGSAKTITGSIIRDSFTWPTWLLAGAFLQGLLTLLPYRNIALVAPVALIVLYQVSRTMLMTYGVIPNHRMSDVIPGRNTIIFPNEKTGRQEKPGETTVSVVVLGIRCNHPLGFLAPGFAEAGKFLTAMNTELNKNAAAHGFLGSSTWTSAGDRGYSGEIMNLLYFESAQAVHDFAHGQIHTEALQWYVQASKGLPYIGLMHELFEAPKGHWEGVYLNYNRTGLGATSKEVQIDGKKAWVNPLVKAKGPLLTSAYRMTGVRPSEKDWPELNQAMRPDGEELYGSV